MSDKNTVISLQGTEMPVHDELCERKVIGSILSNIGSFMKVADILTEDCFQTPLTRGVYDAIKEIDRKGENIDVITVTAELAQEGSTIQPWEVVELASLGVTYDFENYAYRLKELSIRRRLWELGMRLVQTGVAETEDVEDIQQMATEELNGLFGSISGVFTLSEALMKLTDIVTNNLTKGSRVTGTPTGFLRLDEKGGLHPSDLIIIGGESSHGKALPMDAHILTPSGWVENRALKVGDEVCSIDGEPSFVTGVFYRGIRDMYRISFTDGRSTVCCSEHLWEIESSQFRLGNRILNTLQIKEMQENSSHFHNCLSTPSFSGVFGVNKDFIIHPYLLGVLLGDGCLTKGVIWSKPDLFIVKKIKEIVGKEYIIKTTGSAYRKNPSYIITKGKGKVNHLLIELEKLGLRRVLSEDKFIPSEYLNASREQRVELIQGLMDTDGFVSKKGQCTYYTKSERLANDVMYLAHSLGYNARMYTKNAKLNGKDFGLYYGITINDKGKCELFTLPRKKERMVKHHRTRNVIRSVEYVGKMECQCISVSHPRELYITDGFIVTHNSSLMMAILDNAISKGEKCACYSLEMTKEQLSARLVSMKSGIPASDIMYKGDLSPQDLEMFDAAKGMLPGENLLFDDESTSNIDSILLSIRKLKMKYDIKGAAVDYLQILSVNSKTANTREQQMGDAARRLKNLAKELNIWIIALSQLSRNSQEPEPSLNRLRDSGQIAEAADVVMFVYRPSLKGLTFPYPFENVPQEEVEHKAMINVAKGRNIGVFKFLVNFNAETTHFTDLRDDSSYGTVSNYEPVEEDAPF